MNTRHATRTRGVTATLLDLSAHEATSLAYMQEHSPEKEYTKADIYGGPYALATAPDGTEYLIGTEGVGWPVEESNPFDVHCRTETSFAMFPNLTLTLSAEELHDAATGPTVDLADHIRTFGARLDSNHAMWVRTLTEEA